ncbi:LytR/AlgR family response regulator transcription factor [Runella slithyformis]|uniref:Two component transcriptional regulator, LytTR family n=1 Tax=Runella slithyformis (strain ATCC 29530 / DSM 19594 / LMG 11500 / NCIMB 11436 / LSU 4) TaxID=761193 RepID=A0A7U3ZKX4_RUNSL|nr:LytTR family DNA-binding domain-containing protein [Runella slithyformis]AEI49107.1 two component transcriptional regulator, LytTR family [Runella slithyformis DSM 19594]
MNPAILKAIAIDDEPPALRVITHFCGQVEFLHLQKTFSRTDEALDYLSIHSVDLLFLDINMPSMSGIEFYKAIPQEAMVIFTTAYAEYAVEGFNLSAIDYLLKPFTFERFLQAVQKAKDYQAFLQRTEAPESPRCLFIKADYSVYKIAFDDILFIEGLDDYLKIHIEGSKPVVARMTMKNMVEKLPAQDFVRVHRSFIVPFRRIENVRNKLITLAGEEIPIGHSFEKEFFKLFKG